MNRAIAQRAFGAACPKGSVRSVSNGREAVKAFCELLAAGARPFDVCVLDCEMPVLTGLEAAEAIRRAEAGRPSSSGGGAPSSSSCRSALVLWTSLDVRARPLREQCSAAGFDRAFSKQEGLGAVVAKTLSLLPHDPSCPFFGLQPMASDRDAE
eukprot:tig00000190_g13841.t1